MSVEQDHARVDREYGAAVDAALMTGLRKVAGDRRVSDEAEATLYLAATVETVGREIVHQLVDVNERLRRIANEVRR
jgi:hypothetical protein